MIYARYSTDFQNDRSVEDQIEFCQAHAARLGLTVIGSDSDRAKSGASTFGRPGLARIMQAAEAGSFDVLISESPDRISRDIADLAGLHKLLEFRGIRIECVNGGRMDTVQIGMHGVIGQMQREEGAKKTRRGLAGVVRSGRSAGGRAYGYRPIAGKPGELEIVSEEADTIRRIFSLYAVGTAPRSIAAMLNAEGVASPRGTRWNASTINGSGKRGQLSFFG
jgi:site-specific DNA recombinase